MIFTSDLPEVIHSSDIHDEPEHQHDPQHQDLHQEPPYNHHCDQCGSLVCYADDSTYSKSDHDPIALKHKIVLIMASAKNHKLHNNYGITLNTGSEIIEPQNNEKLLGGFISNDLKWFENIRNNEKSLFRILTSRVNALSKICRISNFKTRKMLANGIFMGNLIRLISLWGGAPKFLINILQKLQNRAARLVTKKNIFTPIKILLTQCGWLSVQQLVVFHNVLKIYKTKSTHRPVYFMTRFQLTLVPIQDYQKVIE